MPIRSAGAPGSIAAVVLASGWTGTPWSGWVEAFEGGGQVGGPCPPEDRFRAWRAYRAVRPGRERLGGMVEVDETYIGGEEPGLAGGRAKGKKALVGIAVEITEPRGLGRCRMRILADGSAASLHTFITDHIEPGATVITDGWTGYQGLQDLGYTHEPRSQRTARARGGDVGKLLPGVHRVAALAKAVATGNPPGRRERGAPAELSR